MASDPQAERARLVIEPGSDEPKISGGGHESAAYRPSEDTIDLGRLGDDSDYEFEDEESPAARRRILPLGLAGLALAGFGAIAWYGYQGVTGGIDDEMIPLIQADATPIKSRPLVPGAILSALRSIFTISRRRFMAFGPRARTTRNCGSWLTATRN